MASHAQLADSGIASRGRSIARRLFSAPAKGGAATVDVLARADEARDRRDWDNAARDYAAAIEADLGGIAIHVQLGHALKEIGDYAGAETAYRRFLESRPNDADINLQLGHLSNCQGNLASALEWYEIALKLAPQDEEIARHVALSRARLGRVDVDDKRARAMALVDSGKWTQARFLLNELVTVDGENDLIGVFANVTKESGDFIEAERLYDYYRMWAADRAPDLLPDVELQIGHLHRVMRDEASALRHYIRARDREADRPTASPTANPYDAIVQASIARIYTCFWRP